MFLYWTLTKSFIWNCVSGAADFDQLSSILSNKKDNVYGALLDAYVAGYYKESLSQKKGFRIADVIEENFAYGLLWSRDRKTDNETTKEMNNEMKKCFIRFISLNQLKINEVILSLSQTLEVRQLFGFILSVIERTSLLLKPTLRFSVYKG